ncbi:hypothetical protein HOF65_02650 [bacterium]|jgi:hypothetical protein|nr:hypothetical protein [bacterium]MBT3852900.1 hypothetical protein [bacterium]MBT6779502.1 hypothetical protein [bacterium]
MGFHDTHIACKFHDIDIFFADATLKIFQASIVNVSQESIDLESIT